MIDSNIERLRSELTARNDEILQLRTPGFEPLHDDIRSTPRVVADADPLSVVAPAESRFVVRDSQGRQSFTRDGHFRCDRGMLCTTQGLPVMGYVGESRVLGELRVPTADRLCGRVMHLRLEHDGRLVYQRTVYDPRTGRPREDTVVIGTVALARFPVGTAPLRSGLLERAPIGVDAHIGRPGDGDFSQLRVGVHEEAGIDLNRALARLHDVYQQLDAVVAAQQAARSTTKTALDLVK